MKSFFLAWSTAAVFFESKAPSVSDELRIESLLACAELSFLPPAASLARLGRSFLVIASMVQWYSSYIRSRGPYSSSTTSLINLECAMCTYIATHCWNSCSNNDVCKQCPLYKLTQRSPKQSRSMHTTLYKETMGLIPSDRMLSNDRSWYWIYTS